MTDHVFSLNDPWYDYVKSGKKMYEGRSFKNEKVKALKIGDTILFEKFKNFSGASNEVILNEKGLGLIQLKLR
jgi:ASC-1-like (ASCH) protein